MPKKTDPVKELMRQAAQAIYEYEGGTAAKGAAGCCYAMNACASRYDEYLRARAHFDKLFRPEFGGLYASSYWFANGKRQYELKGAARQKAAMHRSFALLLAAESYEAPR